MQSHALEIAHVAAAARAGQGRFNLYADIHKALRAFMSDALKALGQTDPDDAEDLARTVAFVDELLVLCASHVAHENNFVHPALEARCPGVCAEVAQDHVGHLHHIAHLRDATQGLLACPAEERETALRALYLTLSLFVADNFRHMHVEETVHNGALWNAYTDLELLAVHEALVTSIAPAEMMLVARWMVPHLNAQERLAMLGGMRQGAPADAFQAVLDTVRPHLNDRDWAKLARGLAIPATPGLATA
ncbi:MAG: hemerythrin domain-containing protein [Hydrogenophaga sp.]|uniref:hemerythrin domain-containing protein n=1 Tax=Hydrogenophaga sp. TaxID=1904254 RepID=UPI003D0E9E60